MRITVEQILKALGNGISEKELLKEYPELEKSDGYGRGSPPGPLPKQKIFKQPYNMLLQSFQKKKYIKSNKPHKSVLLLRKMNHPQKRFVLFDIFLKVFLIRLPGNFAFINKEDFAFVSS